MKFVSEGDLENMKREVKAPLELKIDEALVALRRIANSAPPLSNVRKTAQRAIFRITGERYK